MNTDYRQIVAVTGLPGLYQLVSTKNDGAIVKNLADNTIKFVAARKHQVTPLESIEIYTTSDNIRLHEVFEKMKTDDGEVSQLTSKKDNEANKAYFKRILPDYDADRVYTSDINKVIKWYAILKNKDLLNFDYLKAVESPQEEAASAGEDPELTKTTDKEAAVAAPAKKAKAKKEPVEETNAPGAAKSATTKKNVTDKTASATVKEKTEKAPAKKAAPKKKTAETTDTTTPKKTATRKKKEED